MTNAPILDELYETRRRLLMEAGGTLEGLVAEVRKRQHESGRRILPTQRTDRLHETGVAAEKAAAGSGDPRRAQADSGSD